MAPARIGLGILVGIVAFGAIAWVSTSMAPGSWSTLSLLLITVFAIVAALQVGSLVASGKWFEDDTFPKEWSWALLAVTLVLFVLSIDALGS